MASFEYNASKSFRNNFLSFSVGIFLESPNTPGALSLPESYFIHLQFLRGCYILYGYLKMTMLFRVILDLVCKKHNT